MNKKIKLTPKDCLYLDDSLFQLCSIYTQIESDKESITDERLSNLIENTLTTLSEQYDSLKQVLKEASK